MLGFSEMSGYRGDHLKKVLGKTRPRDSMDADAFIWAAYRRWRPSILNLLSEYWEWMSSIVCVRTHREYFVADNLSWLDEAIKEARHLSDVDILSILVDRLPLRYPFIRAFHGCRPDSIESYREHGLLPADPHKLQEIARQMFGDTERINHTFQKMSSYGKQSAGKVYFCLEMDELVERCGHYLLYGSEYLLCIADGVQRDALRRRGRATIVECNVPTHDIPKVYLECLAGEILREIFEKYADRTYRTQIIGFGFHITSRLGADNIVGFSLSDANPKPP